MQYFFRFAISTEVIDLPLQLGVKYDPSVKYFLFLTMKSIRTMYSFPDLHSLVESTNIFTAVCKFQMCRV